MVNKTEISEWELGAWYGMAMRANMYKFILKVGLCDQKQ